MCPGLDTSAITVKGLVDQRNTGTRRHFKAYVSAAAGKRTRNDGGTADKLQSDRAKKRRTQKQRAAREKQSREDKQKYQQQQRNKDRQSAAATAAAASSSRQQNDKSNDLRAGLSREKGDKKKKLCTKCAAVPDRKYKSTWHNTSDCKGA